MKVGDRIKIQPDTFGPELKVEKDKGFCRARPAYPGTVTYIHPSGRWYQVKFDNGVKECFFFDVEPVKEKKPHPIHYGAGPRW